MSYTENYLKRITSLILPNQFANFLSCVSKLAVDHDVLFRTYISNNFDLSTRGLRGVFRTLIDRVDQVYEFPERKSKRYNRVKRDSKNWQSPTEEKGEILGEILTDRWEKAKVMVCGYLECIELLGGPKAGWVEFLRQVGFFYCLAIEGTMEEFLKYQTACLCAISLSNECDKIPEIVSRGHWRVGDFLPYCKRVTDWVRKLSIKRRDPKGVQLAFSIYNVKRIAPAVDETFIAKALEKNLIALTEERFLPDIIRLKDAVVRTVDELYQLSRGGNGNYDVQSTRAKVRNNHLKAQGVRANSEFLKIPSLAACYENPRSKGGSLQYLLNTSGTLKTGHEYKTYRLIGHEPGKYRIEATGVALTNPLVGDSILLGYVSLRNKFSQPVPVFGCLDDSEQISLMRPSLDGRGGRVVVRREAILEPFKVRVISKGEAIPYQRAQNYQPFLWKILQLASCFELSGRPVEEGDVEEVLNFAKTTGVYSLIVSGDYKAATDNLHPWLCTVALQQIVYRWRIPYDDALNMMSCLVGHLIDVQERAIYVTNKFSGKEDMLENWRAFLSNEVSDVDDRYNGDFWEQIWGQLMGSPVSFPILCILNAAVTRSSMETAYGIDISLNAGAFKVNGDDVLFTIPPAGYNIWVRNVTSAGLEPSIGKNYISRRYGVINSQLFDCGNWDDWHGCAKVKSVPLLYLNLLHIQSSTDRRSDEALVIGDAMARGGDLESRMTSLVQGWDEENRERFLKRAYHYAKPILQKLPPVSWVLPKVLGGLGLPKTKDHVVSDLHLKIASMILCIDEKSRRDVVRLQWLKQPGNVFCEDTNEQIGEIHDLLENELVLLPNKTDDVIFGPLIRSNLGLGIDKTVSEPLRVLKSWNNMYSRWVKKVQNIKWTDSKDHAVKGLHAMNADKALSYGGLFWTRKEELKWEGVVKGNLL